MKHSGFKELLARKRLDSGNYDFAEENEENENNENQIEDARKSTNADNTKKTRRGEREIPQKKPKKAMKESISAPLLAAALYLLLLLSRMLDIESLTGKGNIFLVIIVIELMIFVLPGIFYVKLKEPGYITTTNLRLFSPGRIPIIIFAFVAMTAGTILIQLALYRFGAVSAADGAYEAYVYVSTSDDFSNLGTVMYAAVVFAVIPALCEEFIFRAVIMSEYEKLGGIAAVAVSSLLFAMAHFDIKQFFVYLFGGIMLGMVTFVTRSSLAAMILHVMYNMFALFGQSFVWALIAQGSTTVFFIFIIAALFLLFLMLTFGEAERIMRAYARDGLVSDAEKAGRRTQKPIVEALLSPTFIICCAIFASAVIIGKQY